MATRTTPVIIPQKPDGSTIARITLIPSSIISRPGLRQCLFMKKASPRIMVYVPLYAGRPVLFTVLISLFHVLRCGFQHKPLCADLVKDNFDKIISAHRLH